MSKWQAKPALRTVFWVVEHLEHVVHDEAVVLFQPLGAYEVGRRT